MAVTIERVASTKRGCRWLTFCLEPKRTGALLEVTSISVGSDAKSHEGGAAVGVPKMARMPCAERTSSAASKSVKLNAQLEQGCMTCHANSAMRHVVMPAACIADASLSH